MALPKEIEYTDENGNKRKLVEIHSGKPCPNGGKEWIDGEPVCSLCGERQFIRDADGMVMCHLCMKTHQGLTNKAKGGENEGSKT